MIDKQILCEILLELTLATNLSKDYNGILGNAIPRYMKRLNCTVACLLEVEDSSTNLKYMMPSAYSENTGWAPLYRECKSQIEHITGKDQEFCSFPYNNRTCYLFKMNKSRFLLLKRKHEFDKNFTLELLPIVKFLSQSLDMALESERRINAEKKLKKERILLRTIIDHIPDAVYLKDLEHRKIVANLTDVHNMGLNSEAEAIGKSDLDTYDGEAAQYSYRSEQEIIKTGIPQVEIEETLKKKDGTTRSILSSKFPLKDDENNIIGIVGIGKDITDEKAAQKQIYTLSMVASQTTNAVILTDVNGRIDWVNDGFTRLTGYELGEVMQKIPGQILQGEKTNRDTVQRIGRALSQQKPISEEILNYRKNGEEYWVQVNISPLKDENNVLTGYMAIQSEITEQKNIEHKLREAMRIAKAAQESEKLFLTNMSHEIRTPLNAVIGMTNLLYDTNPSEMQKDYLDTLNSSANFLLALISDILDIAKIEAGEINVSKKEFNLRSSLVTLHKTFLLKAHNKSIEIGLKIDPKINKVVGDEKLLLQILNNLMSNAEKFTEVGHITLKALLEDENDNDVKVSFQVVDSGIGISDDNIERIFDKFKQVEGDQGGKTKGTGLGLAITKQLIELQDGHIEAHSEKGKGTTFTFTIPYQKYENSSTSVIIDESSEIEPKVRIGLSKAHLLIVEDNSVNQKYITTLMKRMKIQYLLANNGKEAVQLSQKENFDLVLMDLQMPVMNGYEATINIRNGEHQNSDTPIVALTASAMLDQKEKSLKIGMNGFLTKPFTPNQLKEVLSQYFIMDK